MVGHLAAKQKDRKRSRRERWWRTSVGSRECLRTWALASQGWPISRCERPEKQTCKAPPRNLSCTCICTPPSPKKSSILLTVRLRVRRQSWQLSGLEGGSILKHHTIMSFGSIALSYPCFLATADRGGPAKTSHCLPYPPSLRCSLTSTIVLER